MSDPVIDFSLNEAELVRKIVALTIARIDAELGEHGIFHLALTGGNTGNLVSEALAEEFNNDPDAFQGLHIWWGDERFVSLASEERNDLALRSHLSVESNIHLHSVLPPEEVPDVETSAKRYNIDLQGINLGLVILGAGPDGHVASLFPGMWSNNETRNAIAVGQSPKPPSQRVSLTMKMINSSERVWLLACGENKRNLVLKIRENDLELPVNHVRGTLETVVFVDADSSPSA